MTAPKIDTQAPERILAWDDAGHPGNFEPWVEGGCRNAAFEDYDPSDTCWTLYVRADLFDALTAERDALQARVETMAADLQFMTENRNKWQDAATAARRERDALRAKITALEPINIGYEYHDGFRDAKDAVLFILDTASRRSQTSD